MRAQPVLPPPPPGRMASQPRQPPLGLPASSHGPGQPIPTQQPGMGASSAQPGVGRLCHLVKSRHGTTACEALHLALPPVSLPLTPDTPPFFQFPSPMQLLEPASPYGAHSFSSPLRAQFGVTS